MRQFRGSFSVLLFRTASFFLSLVCLLLLLFLVSEWSEWRQGLSNVVSKWYLFGGLVVGGSVFSALIVYGVGWFWPTTVSANGLRCSTAGGKLQDCPWSDIASVDTWSVYGMPYARIHRRSSPQALYVPLWLADLDEFAREVRTYAGTGCPLVQYLARDGV
jgi:hypothetical protein